MTQAKKNQVATTDAKPLTLRDRIEASASEITRGLPGHIEPDKFIRTVQTAITMTPDLGDACQTRGGLQSLMTACTKAATDGLILDGREAALVTFNQNVAKQGEPKKWEKRVQYIPMVAGLMKKARNSGMIVSISAQVVHEKDAFSYVLGDDERIEHAPRLTDRGAPIAVYAIVKMKDGTVQREVMSRDDVMRIAGQSKNGFQYDPSKGKNFGEWWRKTVIRRISKYLPSSADRDEFLKAVQRIDDDFDYDQGEDGDLTPTPAAKKKRGGAAAALRDITPASGDDRISEPESGDDSVQDHDPETGEVYDGSGVEGGEPQDGDDI